MRNIIPRYYRPDQLENRNVYLTMQWWSQEQRNALKKAIISYLHDWEEFSVHKMKIAHLWERTPFPLELID